jgi:hypothetical protein
MLNKYIFARDWESDYFCVSSSGYTIEVEVKISKADFRADFEKAKHGLFKEVLLKKPYTLENRGSGFEYNQMYQWNEETKIAVKTGYTKHECTRIKISNLETIICPNKFWYACPEGIITEATIPRYAGLIAVSEDGYTIVKDAPFIHKRKLHLPDLLFDKYRWGYQNQANEIESLKHEVWRLSECVKNLRQQVVT